MNKGVIALLVGCLGATALLGGTWATGRVYERQFATQLAALNRQPGLHLNWQPHQQELFQRTGLLHLQVDQDFFNHYQPEVELEQPLDLYLQTKETVLPLHVSGWGRLDPARGSLAELLEAMQLTDLPHELRWRTNVLSHSALLDFTMSHWQVNEKAAMLDFRPLTLHAEGDGRDSASVVFEWQGMELQTRSGVQLAIEPISGSSALQRLGQVWYSPENRVAIRSIKYRAPEERFFLQDMLLTGTISERRENEGVNLDMQYRARFELFNYKRLEADAEPLVLDHLELGIGIRGVDRAGYEALLNRTQGAGNQMVALVEGLTELSPRGMELSLDPCSVNVNREPFKARGHLVLSPLATDSVTGLQELMPLMTGELTVVAAPGLISMLPDGEQQVAPLLLMGYVKREPDGNLSLELKLANGKASANGIPLPL